MCTDRQQHRENVAETTRSLAAVVTNFLEVRFYRERAARTKRVGQSVIETRDNGVGVGETLVETRQNSTSRAARCATRPREHTGRLLDQRTVAG